MHTYRVLGGNLNTDLVFSDLPIANREAEVSWQAIVRRGPPPERRGVACGSDEVRQAGRVLLERSEAGYRLTYPDTGVYDILENGARIEWYQPSKHPYEADRFFEAVRIDILGRVLATAMHAGGIESLHGSAVTLGDGGAIAFVAPKFHGKSTLASTLVARGGRLVTDDTLPVELGPPPRVRPGVHSVRMWSDTATHMAGDLPGLRMGSWGKLATHDLPAVRLVREIVPLAAAYVLVPRPSEEAGAPAARRTRLSSVEAALSLVAHAKIGPLLGRAEAPRLLEWAGCLAGLVPVYRLDVARDLARLPEVASRLCEWHSTLDAALVGGP